MTLSRSLVPAQQDAVPHVVEVWFEPDPLVGQTGGDLPAPIVALAGTLKATPQTITWTSTHSPQALKNTIRGGRLLVRLHCGALVDTKQRQFSATLTALLGVNGLVLPGGVFESWFLIT
jgi:hypothetical protein